MKHRMGQLFRAIDERLEEWIAVPIMIILSLILIIQVGGRYLFAVGQDWFEEVARYLFIYVSYITAAQAVKSDSHIKIAFVINPIRARMGRKTLLISHIFDDLLLILFSAMIIAYSSSIIQTQFYRENTMVAATLAQLGINIGWAYLAIPIGFALIIIRTIQRTLDKIRKHKQYIPDDNMDIDRIVE